MRRLRDRPRIDNLKNDVRKGRSNWTRMVYIALLGTSVLWLGDYFLGPYLYLRSEGMVLAPSATVATEHTATVRNIAVQEGQRVTAGQRIAEVSSQNVAESVARLTADLAALQVRESELRAQKARAASLLQLATDRSRLAKDTRQRYDGLQRQGLLPSDKLTSAVDSEFRSAADAEALRAEIRSIEQQLARMTPAMERAEAALADLQNTYGRGHMAAPFDGVVGRRYVENGAVVTAGAPIAEIYTDKLYVLAYLPTGTFFTMQPGEDVVIDWGVRRVRGEITDVEPVAMALPKEFQTAFKPVARNQVLRIAIRANADEPMPPLFAKVSVKGTSLVDDVVAWAKPAITGFATAGRKMDAASASNPRAPRG